MLGDKLDLDDDLSPAYDRNEPPLFVKNVAREYNFDNLTEKEQIELEKLLELQAADGLDNIHVYAWQNRL